MMEEFSTLASAAFSRPPELQSQFLRSQPLDRVGRGYWLGYADGEAVATGGMIIVNSMAWVFDITTSAGYRGRGYGEAMVRHVLTAAESHCDSGGLSAETLASSLYERIGFRRVGDYRRFVNE